MNFGYEKIEVYDYKDTSTTYGYYDFGYIFNYKNVDFKYSIRFKYLLLMTHADVVLQKDTITLTDKEEYKRRISNLLKEVLPKEIFKIELNRIDYKADIKLESKEMLKEYIKLLDKHNATFYYMKKKNDYDTSIYLTNKTGQHTFNFYDKLEEQKNRKGMYDEKFENVLRLEVQNRPAKLRSQSKKEANPKEKLLDNYYSKEAMEENFFKLITPYLYEGDYYKIEQARKIINKSKYSKKWKEKLKRFLKAVANNKGVKATYNSKYCHEDTGKSYIQKLNNLGINPITLDEDSPYDKLDNLVKLARNIVETKCYK